MKMNFHQLAVSNMIANEAAGTLLEMYMGPIDSAISAIPQGLVNIDMHDPRVEGMAERFCDAVAALPLDTLLDEKSGQYVRDMIDGDGWGEGLIGARLDAIEDAEEMAAAGLICLSPRDTMILFAASKLRGAYGAVFNGW